MQQSVHELYNMGLTSLNLGNPKEALSYFSRVLKLEPDNKKALVKKGNVLGKLGKYSQAVSFYDKALAQEPDDFLALINKGLALHFLERYHEAISCYDMALQLKPNNVTALYNKSSSLIRQNKINEGLQILKTVVDQDFSYKAKAKFDIDFQEIKHLNEFKRLVLF